jgi:cysteine-rich repeat protein
MLARLAALTATAVVCFQLAACSKPSGSGSAVCGNGKLEKGEECDDGNKKSGDGCSAACKKESTQAVCGNGKLETGEQCDDGNKTAGDGCEADCTRTPGAKTVTCQVLAPLASGVCEVTGGDAGKVILGTVLTPDTIFVGGEVVLDATGKILAAGCPADCDADATCQAAAATATVVRCPQGVVSPGLVNPHDHITFTNDPPYTNTGERYEHRHDWRKGLNGHTKIPSPGGATADQIAWGELRFLLGGATSTVGSGGANGLLRNLDRANQQEGLGQTQVDFDTFPLGDSTPPSGYPAAPSCGAYSSAVTEASIVADDAYLPHVAEGIAAYAENEFVCLSEQNPGHNVTVNKSAFIHSIGLTATQYADMAKNGTALIWSPRSNITLYGDTAIITEAARMGIQIALGTDWLPSGSMNLLRELRCADSLNKTYYASYFTDRDLWMMVTTSAAAANAVDDVVGTLAAGKFGDVSIFDGRVHESYRAILDAEATDVTLVMRAGKVLYGDDATVSAIPNVGTCDALDVCGSPKRVCLQSEVGRSYDQLKTAAGGIYPAFFCGVPDNEPSCLPARPASVQGSTIYTGAVTATDGDGDGIPDAQDNCPTIFNPIRPMDGGKQADADGDGQGDACDPCPLDANTTVCKVYDPNDSDGDGFPNATDNCPNLANPDQADADNDGKGDVCDPCPNAANPGNAGCPATIYQVKNGSVVAGTVVSMKSQLVTARGARGFYLQVKPGDPDWSGSPDYSGIFVFDPTNTLKAGDRIDVTSATITNYFAQIELTGAVYTVASSTGEVPPTPLLVKPADVATGGSLAAKYESVLIEVDDVSVTDVNPTPGTGDPVPINEFVVDGALRVNDYLFLVAPFPVVGQNYAAITGVLDLRSGDFKLEPRSASDVLGGAPILSGLSPALSYTDVGQAGTPTFPTPLTVRLSNSAGSDTFVTITSSDPASLTVVGGGVNVLAGQTTAEVLVNGLAQSPSVTLTATLGAQILTANVRVLGPAELPVIQSLLPPTKVAPPGATVTLTVNLDIPSPAGGTVVAVSLNPTNAGTVPATVTVPANQLSTTFDYVDGSTVTSASVTATLGASSASSSLTLQAGAVTGLVINEVDYDNVGTDTAEYVEIYNGSGADVSLSGVKLVLVNGSNSTTYSTVDLSSAGTLAAGQYLVVGSDAALATAAAGALKVSFGAGSDYVQNGAPDGIALVSSINTIADALSYEGAITAAVIAGVGTVSLVEGTVLATSVADSNTVQGSLCRLPNGSDTNDAATDWKFCATLTPGAANVP